jgi:putative FmdB family regulatory protein
MGTSPKRGIVPAYDYTCRQCGERFEVRMSIAAYSEGAQPACETCGSTDVVRTFTTVNVLTAGRGASAPGAGTGCGHTGFS